MFTHTLSLPPIKPLKRKHKPVTVTDTKLFLEQPLAATPTHNQFQKIKLTYQAFQVAPRSVSKLGPYAQNAYNCSGIYHI